MQQINDDIAGCAYGVKETFTIYQDEKKGSLTPSDRAETPSMLRDDQTACSFTSSEIYDLSNVEGTGTPAGKNIGDVVNVVTLWATSDALGAIEDIQTLQDDPHRRRHHRRSLEAGDGAGPGPGPGRSPMWPPPTAS